MIDVKARALSPKGIFTSIQHSSPNGEENECKWGKGRKAGRMTHHPVMMIESPFHGLLHFQQFGLWINVGALIIRSATLPWFQGGGKTGPSIIVKEESNMQKGAANITLQPC